MSYHVAYALRAVFRIHSGEPVMSLDLSPHNACIQRLLSCSRGFLEGSKNWHEHCRQCQGQPERCRELQASLREEIQGRGARAVGLSGQVPQ